MGLSRRARRAKGRIASGAASGPKKSTKASGGVRKASSRAARKTGVLAAARASRERQAAGPPSLLALLPLSEAAERSLDAVRARLASARDSARTQTLCVARGNALATVADGNLSWARDWMIAALDAAKVADSVVLVFGDGDDLDAVALDVFAALRAQGLPQVISVATGQRAGDAALRRERGRELAAESLGEDADLRPINLDVADGPDRVVRRCVDRSLKPLAWRRRYGYALVEDASFVESIAPASVGANVSVHDGTTLAELHLHGSLRGAGLNANQLVMITGVGAFKVGRIISAETGRVLSVRDDAAAEPVETEAPVDPLAGEQNWPPEIDDEDMLSKPVKRKVPKGFSDYQAAWLPDNYGPEIVDEVGNDAGAAVNPVVVPNQIISSHVNDEIGSVASGDEEGSDDDKVEVGMSGSEEYEESENLKEVDGEDEEDMEVDADEVARVREAARDHVAFPDEVDTPVDTPARVRFARYRGLKSLRTSPWDPKEQLPRAYARLFQFSNLRSTRKRVLAEAESNARSLDTLVGQRIIIVLVDVPAPIAASVVQVVRDRRMPVVASGMLRHENRRSVVHFGLQRVDDVDSSAIKAKTILEMHCGFARFVGRPMFSEQNANSDKHKMERYFVHGRYTVASFYGPAIYAPAPALLFHPGGGLIATGSALGADPDRVILKRIVLTGYPFKTQKKRVVVKFMFFNPEDIRWFRPVELWTKLGRTGHIIESLGTHGRMKCIFDSTVLHHDTVCMTMYKRVYPKSAERNDEE